MRKNAILFWVLVALGFLGIVWLLGDTLLPFVCGAIIAYLLGPVVRALVVRGVPRKGAALLILGLFFVLLAGLFVLIVPFAWNQAVQLAGAWPHYAAQVQAHLVPLGDWLQQHFPAVDFGNYQAALKDNIGRIFKFGGNVVGGLVSGGQALAGMATFIVVVPIVAFFVMEEWVPITHWVDGMIPRRNYAVIRRLLSDMDIKISGFIRGQILIALCLGLAYAVALSVAGLRFGFLIGLLTGVFSIIPLVGSTLGLLVSLLVAGFQSYSFSYVALIAVIFFTGQFIEGNIITPRIMGKSVGLHPAWILFSLMTGGALFGLVGMFLAVPVAAIASVLLAFAIAQYKASPYYSGDREDGLRHD